MTQAKRSLNQAPHRGGYARFSACGCGDHGLEVTDRKGALQAMSRCKANLGKVQSVLADSGYVGQPFAQAVKETLGEEVTVQIAKRSELRPFAVIPAGLWPPCLARLREYFFAPVSPSAVMRTPPANHRPLPWRYAVA